MFLLTKWNDLGCSLYKIAYGSAYTDEYSLYS